jgi:hypothetical protein
MITLGVGLKMWPRWHLQFILINEDVGGDFDLIKLKIPTSQGKNDPEMYLKWEKKVDWVFDYRSYSKAKKLKR